jgi:hypothetical protein
VAVEAGEAMKLRGMAISLEDCLLTAGGTLEVDGEPRGRLAPEAALRALLTTLLAGQPAPDALRTLVAGPPDQPAGSGLEALLAALAYFERPQRDADIMALAARGLAADAEARTEIELGKLRRGSPRHGHQPPPTARPHSAKVPKKTLAFGAAVLAWFLVGVAATGLYVRRALTPSSAPAPTADTPAAEGGAAADASPSAGRGGVLSAASDVMDRAAKAGLRAIGIVPADNASPDPARVEVPKPAAPAAPRRPSAASAPHDSGPAPLPSDRGTATSVIPEMPAVAADPPGAIGPPDSDPVFFTELDGSVAPPVLVYPQLPIEASPAGIKPGASYFELLVSEDGTVERVRLMASQARLQDRMMVSAAKAWRFRPATKDGRPVRYLLRTPTTN